MCLPAHRTGKLDSSRKCCVFIPQKKKPQQLPSADFCSLHLGCHHPWVLSVSSLALGLPPKHPNSSPWLGMPTANTAVSFPLHKSSSLPFPVPLLKAALFTCNCLLDPVLWLPTCGFFPLSLAAGGVKCQVVEDIFYSHSIWLPGWLLCQWCCWLWSYLCSCLVFKSMELLHPPYAVFLSHFSTALNVFPEINTSLHSFHMGSRWEISLERFFSSCWEGSREILQVHPRSHLWYCWELSHGFMTDGICSKNNHLFC